MRRFAHVSLLMSITVLSASAIAANDGGDPAWPLFVDSISINQLHMNSRLSLIRQSLAKEETPVRSKKRTPALSNGGVTHEQAMDVALTYVAAHVGCGGLDDVVDAGTTWKVIARIGYAGVRTELFRIHKATGARIFPEPLVQ
jgi:hypothetical protein